MKSKLIVTLYAKFTCDYWSKVYKPERLPPPDNRWLRTGSTPNQWGKRAK